MKKTTLVMLSALMFLALGLSPVYSQTKSLTPQPVKDDDFEVTQNADNTITITNYKGTAKNIIIPDTLYGLKVTIIGEQAFTNKGLTSVVIPDTVITIQGTRNFSGSGSGAFTGNQGLSKVTLGKGLKTIGFLAFAGTGLTEIIIPDSVTTIGYGAFRGYTNYPNKLSRVTFGKGLQTIDEYAFYLNQITELDLPSSLKEIGESAFENNKIQKITFGTGLQTIGISAFEYNQIKELNLPSSLKTIKDRAFANNQIQSLNIPNGVTSISDAGVIYADGRKVGAFLNNPLTTVVIPASLAKGNDFESTFKGITTITSITIPAGMDESDLRDNFEEAFVNFWINQNRAGGTYIRRGPIWSKQ